MAIYRIKPYSPIPNNPFYFPETESLNSATGPLIVGSGITVNYATGVISSTGGGGAGNVQVVAPITDTGTPSAPVIGVQTASVGQLGVVQIGANVQIFGGAISILDSATTHKGVVQLNDTTTSTSTTEALTAAQGKFLQDQIDNLSISSNLILAGTFDAATSQLVTVTNDGASAGFNIGLDLPPASPSNANYFVIVTTGGTYTPPGGTSVTCKSGDWFLSSGTDWSYLAVGAEYPAASTTTAGIVRLATATEAEAGLDDSIALTPFSTAGFIRSASYTSKGSLITASDPGVTTLFTAGGDGCFLVADSTATSGLSWQSNNAIPCSCITGRGALITGTDSSLPFSLPLGAAGQVLTVSSTPGGCGLVWCTSTSGSVISVTAGAGLCGGTITTTGTISLPLQAGVIASAYPYPSSVTVDDYGRITAISSGLQPIPQCTLSAKGDLISSSGSGPAIALGVGSNGQVLTVDSSAPAGIKWAAVAGTGTVTSISQGNGICIPGGPLTTTGTICLAPISPAINVGTYTTPELIVDCYGRITSICQGVPNIPITCITGKGALISGTGSNNPYPLGIGSQGQVLTVDTGTFTGLAWTTPATGGIPCSCLNARGALVTATSPGCLVTLGIGSDSQVLTANSGSSTGMSWSALPCASQTAFGMVLGDTTNAQNLTALGCANFSNHQNFGVCSCNIAIGFNNAALTCCGVNNTFVGTGIARSVCWLNRNVAMGYRAAWGCNGSGSQIPQSQMIDSVVLGWCALTCVCGGNGVVVIGSEAAKSLRAGVFDVIIGYNAACLLPTGSSNVLIGCCVAPILGCENTGFAVAANVIIGACSGRNIIDGSGNLLLGSYISFPSNSYINNCVVLSNQMSPGQGICASFGGISSCTNWAFTSDARLKTDVQDLALGLDFISQVQPRTFKWNFPDTPTPTERSSGFVAQELLEVVNQFDASYTGLVDTSNPDKYSVAATALIPVLVNAIKELSTQVTALRCEVNVLKGG